MLETLKDPAIPYGTIVLWTDAGVHFIAELRPLLEKYLAYSDVTATETPMLEADVSKRDAFILLDADYEPIIFTNQIATGIIAARKTPLAIRFMEKWLRACEDERIITEEPSVLGGEQRVESRIIVLHVYILYRTYSRDCVSVCPVHCGAVCAWRGVVRTRMLRYDNDCYILLTVK